MNITTLLVWCVVFILMILLMFQNYYYYKDSKKTTDLDDIIIYEAMMLSVSASKTHEATTAMLQISAAIVKLETLLSIRGRTSSTIERTLMVLFHQKKQLYSVLVPDSHPLHDELVDDE